ncbi:MAG TPA: hypothetical protein VN969_03930 [Streptosporangiaceae bacterium]|nr:hypothetical protein [Streptosporangiaceae bacterium]
MSPFRHGDHGGHDSTGSHGNPAHPPMRDPVAGKALVIAINSFLDWQTSGHLQLSYMFSGPLTATLVVEAEGVPKTTVEHAEQVPRGDDRIISRWPDQGDTVPVMIDRAEPSRIQFQWDQMPTEQDRIARMKQAQAKRLLERAYKEPPAKLHRPLP